MASEFLLISSPDWHEIPNATYYVDLATEEAVYAIMTLRQEYPVLDTLFENTGIIPEGNGITDVFLINTGGAQESRFRMWVQYAPYVYTN